jgi:hypothetical protein
MLNGSPSRTRRAALEQPTVRPAGSGRQITHEIVAAQVLRSRRHAVGAQVLGRAAGEESRGHDAACDEMRLAHCPYAHHQIDLLADQIDASIVELHLQLEIRIARGELRQRGDQQRAAELHRNIHAQPAFRRDAGTAHRLIRRLELGQDALTSREVLGTIGRQAHTPCGAMKQLGTQVILELRDMRAHHRTGKAERLGRLGEGVQIGDAHEAAHAGQLVHGGIVWEFQTIISRLARFCR